MFTVLCFGDSNTYGAVPTLARTGRHRFARERRWPGVMARALGSGWHVVEEGQPSRTTVHADPIEGAHKSGLAALPVCLESHMPVDLVVVMLGTNDFKGRFSVSAGDVSDSIEVIVRFIQGGEAGPDGAAPKVLVVAPHPVDEVDWFADMFRGAAAKSRLLPELVRQMCARNRIAFLAAGDIVEASVIDGIHLDLQSHRKLGLAMAEAVRQVMAES